MHGRLRARRNRRARRTPGDNALGVCDDFARRYPDVTVDADPDLRPRRKCLDLGRRHGRYGSRTRARRRRSRTGRRADHGSSTRVVRTAPGGQSQFSAQLGAQLAARQPLRDLSTGSWSTRTPTSAWNDSRRAYADEPASLRPRVPRRSRLHSAVYVESARVEWRAGCSKRLTTPSTGRARSPASACRDTRRAFARRVGTSPSNTETASGPPGRLKRDHRGHRNPDLRQVTALDAIGPYEVLQPAPEAGEVRCRRTGAAAYRAGKCSPRRRLRGSTSHDADVLLVPVASARAR